MATAWYAILLTLGLCASLYDTTSTTTPAQATTLGPYHTPCGLCGRKIDVTLRVQNFLRKPYFSYTVQIRRMRKRQLIFFLQKAADMRVEFRFSASYGQWGYFIDTMNGLETNYDKDETWWHIKNQTMSLPLGSSSYIPYDGEIITYEFVQRGPH
ncbi:uncharacterized protein LOC124286157 [Haliotis rubra]|uniref:uncharacterized protein LOC124286157 n=1 Tax=Haliotis rubra TaxID=36100 RepID=UPI001EE5F910|nr:uncharacterized protein LOC124286157 [Haliotis rubra]